MHSLTVWSIALQGSVHNLLPAFDLLANVLMQSGSAERESTAMAVHQRIRQDLRDSANDSAQLSAALVRALRIMRSQLHLLSFDTMAFALNSLRSHIRRAESGVEYVSSADLLLDRFPHLHMQAQLQSYFPLVCYPFFTLL